jgi:hypothetical protein
MVGRAHPTAKRNGGFQKIHPTPECEEEMVRHDAPYKKRPKLNYKRKRSVTTRLTEMKIED